MCGSTEHRPSAPSSSTPIQDWARAPRTGGSSPKDSTLENRMAMLIRNRAAGMAHALLADRLPPLPDPRRARHDAAQRSASLRHFPRSLPAFSRRRDAAFICLFQPLRHRAYPQNRRVPAAAGAKPLDIQKHLPPGCHLPALSDRAPAIEASDRMPAGTRVRRRHPADTLAAWRRRFEAQARLAALRLGRARLADAPVTPHGLQAGVRAPAAGGPTAANGASPRCRADHPRLP